MCEGYIGGSVLHRLLHHPNAKSFDITVLVRSPEKGKKLEDFGVKAITGSLDDHALVEELSSQAHVIIDTVRVISAMFNRIVSNTLIYCYYRLIQIISKPSERSSVGQKGGMPQLVSLPYTFIR